MDISKRSQQPGAIPPQLDPPKDDALQLGETPFELPPLPAVVRRVLDSIRSGQATAAQIGDLLSADPGLVVRILKIVNSAYYGLPRRIAEVRQAVAYLGLGEIERLAMTATVMKEFSPTHPAQLERFWFHSFYTALVSKQVARLYAEDAEADKLHTAALLHDIGKLVYLRFLPEEFLEIEHHCRTQGVLFRDAEETLGFPSHVVLGSMLCEQWDLPDCVKRSCARHELADLATLDASEPDSEQTLVVAVANLLSNLAIENLAGDVKATITSSVKHALGCGEPDFLLLMGEVYGLRLEVEGFLRQL